MTACLQDWSLEIDVGSMDHILIGILMVLTKFFNVIMAEAV